MYLDILAGSSYGKFNRKLAKLAGIYTAVYFSELLDDMVNVVKDNLYDELGYFTVDREKIKEKTTLDETTQISCDKNLEKVGIMSVSKDDSSKVRVDLEKAVAILLDEDINKLKEVSKLMTATATDKQEAKRLATIRALKNSIQEMDPELLECYKNWIDAVCVNYPITKAAVTNFISIVRKYSSDVAVQRCIVNIAMTNAWKDAAWAINNYERNYMGRANLVRDNQRTTKVKEGVEF